MTPTSSAAAPEDGLVATPSANAKAQSASAGQALDVASPTQIDANQIVAGQALAAQGPAAASTDAATPSTAGTVANLSAQIVQQSGQKTSRFDLQLDPAGLGRVDVAVQIDAKGRVTAALSFEKSDSATLLQGQAGALSDALTQAGLSVAPGAISFAHNTSAGDAAAQSASAQTAFNQGGGHQGSGQQSGSGGQPSGNQTFNQASTQSAGGQTTGQSGGQNSQERAPPVQPSVSGARAFDAAALAATTIDQQYAAYRTLGPSGVDIRI